MKELLLFAHVFIDGRGYAGQATSVEVPKLEALTREFSAGGMSGPVKVRTGRHKELTSKIKFGGLAPDMLSLFDIAEGRSIAITARASTQDRDGTTHAHVVKMRGFIETLDEGEWKEGGEVPTGIDLALDYYKREHDGVELIEADPINMIFKVRGVDQLAQHRRNIGR